MSTLLSRFLSIFGHSADAPRPSPSAHDEPHGKPVVSKNDALGLVPTEKDLALEQDRIEERLALIESTLSRSGFVRPEKLQDLMQIIRATHGPFARVSSRNAAADDGPLLTVAEKKVLGLNSRMKYHAGLIHCFQPEAFRTIEPKQYVADVQLDAFHRVSKKGALDGLRALGVEMVELSHVNDGRDCARVGKLKRTHRIGDAPELPLPDCDAPYCRCIYLPKL